MRIFEMVKAAGAASHAEVLGGYKGAKSATTGERGFEDGLLCGLVRSVLALRSKRAQRFDPPETIGAFDCSPAGGNAS
jgi:hypothetical protein